MSLIAQLTANGLIAGSMYALVAVGFSLIYGTNKIMHFAHGSSVAVAGYLFYVFVIVLKIPHALAVLPTLALAGVFGFVMYRTVYEPLRKRKASTVILLVASIALLILMQNVIQAVFGAEVKTLAVGGVGEGLAIAGARITLLQCWIIIIALVLFALLYGLMNRTLLGKKVRAVADNAQLASVGGISTKNIADFSFVIGSILAGIAGILIGMEQNLEPGMGTSLMIKGFTGAVIGGLASVPAAFGGSMLLGLAENYGIALLPSGYKDAIAFVILFVFLLLRPEGLFGRQRRKA